MNELLPYYQPYSFPQTSKLIAYLGALILIPLVTLLLYHVRKKITFFLSIISFIFIPSTLAIIVYKTYQNIKNYSQIFTLDPVFFNKYFLILILSGVLFSIIIYFSLHFRTRVRNFIRSLDKIRFLLVVTSILMIVVTLYDRNFEEKDLFLEKIHQYQHTSVFVGPVFDLMKGRVILVNTDSQYGIFINVIPAIIFKLFPPLTFTRFFYLMILYGILYYLVAYFLLLKHLKSKVWAALGMILLFSLHFYPSLDRYTRPMMFPIRTVLDLPFFLLLLSLPVKRLTSQLLLSFYLAFAIFYNYETGLSLTAAYIFSQFLINIRNAIKPVVQNLYLILFWILLVGFFYSLYAKFVTGSFPNWSNAFFYFRIFSQGLAAGSDFPIIGLYLLPLSIYFFYLIKAIINTIKKKFSSSLFWETCLAVYGLSLFNYYLSRPYILNLPSVSIPAIILGLILLRNISNLKPRFALFTPYLVLSFLISFSLVYYFYRISINYKHDYWKGNHLESAKLYDELKASAETIKKYEPNQKEVALVSYFDTFLGLKADKSNSLPFGTVQNVITIPQLKTILTYLNKTQPTYIYADIDPQLEINLYSEVYNYIRSNYKIVDTSAYLNVWRRI